MYQSYTVPPEPYGQVRVESPNAAAGVVSGGAVGVMHRRVADPSVPTSPATYTASPPSSYTFQAPPSYSTDAVSPSYGYTGGLSAPPPPAPKPAAKKDQALLYPHNGIIAIFWIPCLLIVLQGFESSTPMVSCICVGLALYALDLAHLRQSFLFGVWFSVFLMTMLSGWFVLVEDEDEDNGGAIVLFYLAQIAVMALLYACGACWITLQVQWLSPNTTTSMEQTLHALLPLVSSSIIAVQMGNWLEGEIGRDASGILAPFIFCCVLAIAMMTIGCAAPRNPNTANAANGSTSEDPSKEKKTARDKKSSSFIVSAPVAFGHTFVLLVGPVAMHLATCLGRLVNFYASTDDLYDLVLVQTVPFMIQYMITLMNETGWWPSPYPTPRLGNSKTVFGVLRPMIVGLSASLALQQRYMITLSHSLSYLFNDGVKSPAWLISVYLTGATVSLIFTMSIWGRVSSITNETLFGEYHEDVLQFGLSLTGLLLGKGIGLPWNFTPLPVLAFLGLSLWLTTRMFRYLAIFLFVLHATGVVVFTYRFAGINDNVALPIRGLELPLIRFAMAVVGCSILVGVVAGLAVRSSGGFGSSWIRKLDLVGVIFILYMILLMALEISLLKRPVPVSELVGVVADEASAADMLYDPIWAFVTSTLAIVVSIFMHTVKLISGKTFGIIISLAVGKALSIYVDSVDLPGKYTTETTPGAEVFLRSIITAALCSMMFYPRFLLKPVYVKTAAIYRRSLSNTKGNTQLPPGTERVAILYVFIVLPLSLVVSVPYVLIPLANALKADFQGLSFYDVSPPASEVIGFALTLWGMSSLFMLNYYLPDCGGEVWKKLAALGFLSGLGIFFAAPTLGFAGDAMSNPYATISSVGIQAVNQGKSRTGGWGLVSAGIATLLALTGPLELKERRTDSTRRDKFLLFRTMMFSILFGGGAAWFIIMQSMSEAPWLVLLLTGLSCLSISFLGTISSVLGYFIELEDMEEVEQVYTIWLVAIPIFLPVTGLPQFLNVDSSHPFGVGGWLSTYLAICCAALFAFALSMRARPTKNPMTRGLGNLSVVLSWACAICVLYGRYGVAGMDVNYDVTTVFGIPVSIFGTFILSLLLLALEGESSGHRGGRTQRVTTQSQKRTRSSLGLVLENLTLTNAWVPLVAGTATVLVLASAFAVLLRGAWFLSFLGGGNVARSHEEVFSNVFGDKKDEHDLATLAEKAILHVKALATSAKLAGAGFWTAEGTVGPLFHLVGVVAVVPSLYLLVSHGWRKGPKKLSPFVILCLPLNAVPLVLSRGIPSLQAAAILGAVGGSAQVLSDRRAAHASKMRI